MAHKFLSGPFYLFQLIPRSRGSNEQTTEAANHCFKRAKAEENFFPTRRNFSSCVGVVRKRFCDWKIYDFIMNFDGKVLDIYSMKE